MLCVFFFSKIKYGVFALYILQYSRWRYGHYATRLDIQLAFFLFLFFNEKKDVYICRLSL